VLISNAEIRAGAGPVDVRITSGRITAIGRLPAGPGEAVLQAGGGALLPGLHDHHLHLMSLAASLESLPCGPPDINTADELAAVLKGAPIGDRNGWIRGIGYHDSVAGEIDRAWLDRHGPDRPVRVQHRSGRLWVVNSPGLEWLAAESRSRGMAVALPEDGRLYDGDRELRSLLGAVLPPIHDASHQLARFGVTGVTDMTPSNGPDEFALFERLQREGRLLQQVRLCGIPDLDVVDGLGRLHVGETKIHLHESGLPPFDAVCAIIRNSHRKGRGVALHCVTEAELVFAVAALRDAEPDRHESPHDRIEHASVAPPALLEQLRALEVTVVTQPNFVYERGDAYIDEIPAEQCEWLYRCQGVLDAGIRLAAGSDAPFGAADPWRAMRAAVTRTTRTGRVLGSAEAVSPERALGLFLGPLEVPAASREVVVGAVADLCLLDRPWSEARQRLDASDVRATLRAGELIFDRVDEPPAQCNPG